jgi:hypothetical protein
MPSPASTARAALASTGWLPGAVRWLATRLEGFRCRPVRALPDAERPAPASRASDWLDEIAVLAPHGRVIGTEKKGRHEGALK